MTTCTRCGRQHTGYGLCPQCRSEEDANKRRDRIFADQQYLIRQQQRQFDRAQSESRAQAEGEAKRAAFTAKFIEISRYAKERNLISLCVNVDFSLVENYKDILLTGHAKAFADFVTDATKDDRCIDLSSFGLTMTKSSTLKDLRDALSKRSNMNDVVLLQRAASDSCEYYACSSLAAQQALPEGGYEGKEVKIQGFNYIFFVAKADLPKCLALLADTESKIFGAYLQIEDIKKKHADALPSMALTRSGAKPLLFTLIRALVILLASATILLYSYSARLNSLLFAFLCIVVAIAAFTMLIKEKETGYVLAAVCKSSSLDYELEMWPASGICNASILLALGKDEPPSGLDLDFGILLGSTFSSSVQFSKRLIEVHSQSFILCAGASSGWVGSEASGTEAPRAVHYRLGGAWETPTFLSLFRARVGVHGFLGIEELRALTV